MASDTDDNLPVVRDGVDGQAGTFGLNDPDSPSKWNAFIQPGKTPTPAEIAFAHRCTRLRDRLERFERGLGEGKPRFDETHIDIRDSFSAGLVRAGGVASLEALNGRIDDIEHDFVVEHGIPRYRNRVQTTLLIGVAITFLMLAVVLATMLYWNPLAEKFVDDEALKETITTDDTQKNFNAFAFVILGVLFGRIISLFMDYGKHIQSFDAYDSAYRVIASPFMDASIDVLIGFVACLCFVTGAIVIAIGATSTGEAGLSTLQIREHWEIAMVFGLLIGLVRAQFLSRLTNTAKSSVG